MMIGKRRDDAPLSNSENASLNSAECHKPRSAPRTTAHTLCTHQRFALFAAGDGRVSDQNIVSRAVTRQTFRLGRKRGLSGAGRAQTVDETHELVSHYLVGVLGIREGHWLWSDVVRWL